MLKKIFIALLLISVLGLVGAAASKAQNDAPDPVKDECKASELLESTAKLIAAKDQAADMQMLNALADQIGEQRVLCYGYTFKGKGTQVIDPFDLPEGAYKIKLEYSAKDSGAAYLKNIGEDFCNTMLTNTSTESSITVFDGCRAVIDVSPISPETEWTITIEPLK